MKHPMAEVPAASNADAGQDEVTPDTPPAQPALGPASKDGQGAGGPAEVLGPDVAAIGNWPEPM